MNFGAAAHMGFGGRVQGAAAARAKYEYEHDDDLNDLGQAADLPEPGATTVSSANDGKGGLSLQLGDVALAAKFQADVKDMKAVRIPWYIVDPTGDAIKRQRREDRAKRENALLASLADQDGDGSVTTEELQEFKNKMLKAAEAAKSNRRLGLASRRSPTRNAMAESFRGTQTKPEQESSNGDDDKTMRRLTSREKRLLAEPMLPAWLLEYLPWPSHDGFLEAPTLFPTWDIVTGVALIVTATTTPFEVGFLPPPKRADEALFILNRVIDGIFLADVMLQFFLMYRKESSSAEVEESAWEVRLDRIAHRYVKSRFFYIDILSLVPSIFDIMPVVQGGDNSSPKALKTPKSIPR